MFIPEDEKSGRKEALQKLIKMMGKGSADSLMGFKKAKAVPVATEIEVDFGPDADEGEGEEVGEVGEAKVAPSDDEKSMIEELYHKYCM